MADCDFSTYVELSNVAQAASIEAQASCASLNTANDALEDAQAAVAEAQQNKAVKYDAWQQAKRAVNAEAARLGIDPIPPGAP